MVAAAPPPRYDEIVVQTPTQRVFEWALLGMLASSYVALLEFASHTGDRLVLRMAAAAIALRALQMFGWFRLRLPALHSTGLALLAMAGCAIEYLVTRDLVTVAVHLVALMAFLVVIRAATPRDYFFVKAITFFQLLAASTFATGLVFPVCLLVYVVCAILAQTAGVIERPLEAGVHAARLPVRASGWRLVGVSAFAFAAILLLGVGFFFILPRNAHAALRHLLPGGLNLPGFSSEVTLGRIGEIQASANAPAVFHFRSRGSASGPLELKWRGSALAVFDGRRWYNPPWPGEPLRMESGYLRLAGREQLWRPGRRLEYEVQLKDATGDVLFFPGIPEILYLDAPVIVRTPVGGVRTAMPNPASLRYSAQSFVEDLATSFSAAAAPLPEGQRETYLRTPRADPRVTELAHRLTSAETLPLEKARRIEEHLRTRFAYSLELPKQIPNDPIAHFLFDRRRGHCEYFASSMAIMLRLIGIPSRLATGFQSGTYNPLTGWHLVRSSDAHAWVEAHFPGQGWVTFDPTPSGPVPPSSALMSQLRLYLDALEVNWQDWVVTYDLDRQVQLADRLGERTRAWSIRWIESWDTTEAAVKQASRTWLPRTAIAMAVLCALAAAGYLLLPPLLVWWRRRSRLRQVRSGRAEPSDATLLYERLLELLLRRGVQKPVWMTPSEFVEALPQTVPRELVAQATMLYQQMRFGQHLEVGPRLAELLDRLAALPQESPSAPRAS